MGQRIEQAIFNKYEKRNDITITIKCISYQNTDIK